jgi:hypothetical protein
MFKQKFCWSLFLLPLLFVFIGCSSSDNDNCNNNEFVCDPNEPVVLNGVSYCDGNRIARNSNGCVIGMDFGFYRLVDPNCLQGIGNYGNTLEELDLLGNCFDEGLNLAPLTDCPNLERLDIDFAILQDSSYRYGHKLDISSLTKCKRLKYLNLDDNEIDTIDLSPLNELDSLNLLRLQIRNSSGVLDVGNFCIQVTQFIESHPNCLVYSICADSGYFAIK